MSDTNAISAILAHILPRIKSHRLEGSGPFIFGLSGLQGSGKSTWATALAESLNNQHGIRTCTLSLDDLYLDHANLVRVRDANPTNVLLRNRGQPGTHDERLAKEFFDSLGPASSVEERQGDIRLPSFDKSQFHGEGDRVPWDQWQSVPRNPPLDVLIFEGWCVGFQPLENTEVEAKWAAAKKAVSSPDAIEINARLPDSATTETLAQHELSDLLTVNENLGRYCSTFMGPSHLNCLVCLSTDDLGNVYRWRIEQEHALLKSKGSGMSDEQVVKFVEGYMPAYELYLDRLVGESFWGREVSASGQRKHLRVVLDVSRTVSSITEQ